MSSNPNSVNAALTQAQSIIASAEKRALEIKSAAEKAYEESKQKGYDTGFKQGLSESGDTAVRLIKDSGELGEQLTQQAAKLALAICSAVIGEQVKVDPELVKKIAERALQQSIVGDVITINCHPDEQEILKKSVSDFRRLANGAGVTIEADPTITPGGCIVRTEFGEVDASIPVLLESMAANLGLKKKK